MRRWLQFGLFDFLVAIVLLPPGAVLTFQATLLLLRATHEQGIETGMQTLSGSIIVECYPFEPMTDRERLEFLKRLVVDSEAALVAGELDLVTYPDIEECLDQWRGDIARLELRLAAEDFLKQPTRDEFQFAAERMR